MAFLFYKQPDEMACGATCLRMVSKNYGKNYSVKELLQVSGTTREGANLQGLSEASEKIGFRTLGVKVSFDKLVEDASLHFL
jgi:ATP-binding cassette subfamily B protein